MHAMTLIQHALQSPDVLKPPDALNIFFETIEKILEALTRRLQHLIDNDFIDFQTF